MKNIVIIIFLFLPVISFSQAPDLQNMATLASQYYVNKEFAKAAELYEKLYENTKSEGYLNIYFECLLNIPDYEKAEREIRKGIRGNKSDAYWYVQWGFLNKALGKVDEAVKMYDKAISSLTDNPNELNTLANQFINRREYEYAEKVYLLARKSGGPALYNYELGRVYYYMRNYDSMMREYIDWLKINDANIEVIKSNLQSVLTFDNDNEISNQLKKYLIKSIQLEPENLINNRLLIWLFNHEKNFYAAITQSIAIDKRTGKDDANIFGLGNIAMSNKFYDDATRAFEYLVSKGSKSDFYNSANLQIAQIEYQKFIDEETFNIEKANLLKMKLDQFLLKLGLSVNTYKLQIQYAHLLGFYLKQPAEAVEFLTKTSEMEGLNQLMSSEIKSELADLYVCNGDLWEAVLAYSQIIDINRSNVFADDLKYKKAMLGYYMGNFSWSKAQLDALRASTSKLIANDAMEMSLFLSENIESDSTSSALKMFGRADLLLFKNNFDQSILVLDSISNVYQFSQLADDVYFRKATIFQKLGKFDEAAILLEKITKEFGRGILADDAIFQLAGLYLNKLNRVNDAMNLYKKMLTDYPGSIHVVDSRTEFRKIEENLKTKEDRFFNNKPEAQ